MTLPVTRGVFAFADGTIGSVEPREGLIHTIRCCHCYEHEVPVRCRQLAMFYEDTENRASGEIKIAAYKISLQQSRIVLAQETVLAMRQRLDGTGKNSRCERRADLQNQHGPHGSRSSRSRTSSSKSSRLSWPRWNLKRPRACSPTNAASCHNSASKAAATAPACGARGACAAIVATPNVRRASAVRAPTPNRVASGANNRARPPSGLPG